MAENMKNGLNLGVYDGINFRVELPKVRGGSMLWSIIDHMDHKITCLDPQNTGKSFCKWMNKLKYFVYSAVSSRSSSKSVWLSVVG
ncbi:hypothetical protein AB6A40_008354 [Gnathostoma spinigerum]|uniref:Uncharacterized protein n=1 Tax=Gnathostoma spinigerum TaxID=75299 RepID=A0ABD6EZC4_9BILA